MDTSKDIRIAFAEKLVANLSQQAASGFFGSIKKHPQVRQGLNEIANLLMAMKYSYLDDEALYEMAEQETLRSTADQVIDTLSQLSGKDTERLAILRFYRLTVRQFKEAFKRGPELESTVVTDVGRVVTVSKHPKAKNLLLCRVDVFGENLAIVTNLVQCKPRQHMKVALVPPDDVMGVFSEAQFIGPAADATDLGLDADEKREIRKTMGAFLGRG